ncbi:hypothetical protein R3P38DRAFT_3244295 [Favolaschia claudopus]|uniref:Uncharacterized protein n=1 Tax=Favolaschia claudopus TaxID=2862362 RepID=A0AAV9Z1T1_9AGAR
MRDIQHITSPNLHLPFAPADAAAAYGGGAWWRVHLALATSVKCSGKADTVAPWYPAPSTTNNNLPQDSYPTVPALLHTTGAATLSKLPPAPDIFPLFCVFVYVILARAASPQSFLQKVRQWESAESTSGAASRAVRQPRPLLLPPFTPSLLSSLHLPLLANNPAAPNLASTLPAQTDGASVTPSTTVSSRRDALLLPDGHSISPSLPFITITSSSNPPLFVPSILCRRKT